MRIRLFLWLSLILSAQSAEAADVSDESDCSPEMVGEKVCAEDVHRLQRWLFVDSAHVTYRFRMHKTLTGKARIFWEFHEDDMLETKGNATTGGLSVYDISSRPRMTATVNGAHSGARDVLLHLHGFPHRRGHLEMDPDTGWMGTGSWALGFISGEVVVFMCPEDYEVAVRDGASLTDADCIPAAANTFRTLSISAYAGYKAFELFLNLPLAGKSLLEDERRANSLRAQVVAKFPKKTDNKSLDLVLDWLRTILHGYIELYIQPDDYSVEQFFGSDEVLHRDNQIICMATTASQAGMAQRARAEKEANPGAVTYAHKLGTLLMAVSAFDFDVCVETGTYDAETAIHLASFCKSVYTIELSTALGSSAQEKIEWARDRYGRNVTLMIGNSGDMLLDARIHGDPRPALFYLDGHYSGGPSTQLDSSLYKHFGSPLLAELHAIFSRQNDGDVIFIDDGSHFLDDGKVNSEGYPSFEEVQKAVCREAPLHRLQVKDNSLRIYRRAAAAQLRNSCCHFGGLHGEMDHSLSGEVCSDQCKGGTPEAKLDIKFRSFPLHYMQ